MGSGFHKSLLIFPCVCVYSHMLGRDCLGVCAQLCFSSLSAYIHLLIGIVGRVGHNR